MDVLRALASPDADVRAKTLALALDLVTARSIDGVVGVLKKEVVRAQAGGAEGGAGVLRRSAPWPSPRRSAPPQPWPRHPLTTPAP